jgi:class 3 adenylate cyclase
MPEDRVDRRLAAIFAGDIAGYSRLMSIDEEGTLRQLKGHRKELVDPKITEHRGRVVKTTGDGMLVEFVSVVDAVRCAVDIQRGMVEREMRSIKVGSSFGARELFTRCDTGHTCRYSSGAGRSIFVPMFPASHRSC